jgi:membrane protein YdbS with pleckstrin-like domain
MEIKNYINSGEHVLWTGKPNKAVFIKERIFSPLFIVAAVWLMFDLAFIGGFLGMASDNLPFSPLLLVPFFALHLLPVWIYIFRVVFAFREWRNTDYMVTDKAVYATKGVFTTNCDRKTFQEITNVSVHQGIIDKSHNVGDVFIITGFTTNSKGQSIKQGINIIDVEDYLEVYKLITRTGTDIFSDTMYPNDLRPKENHGYKTKYNPDEE